MDKGLRLVGDQEKKRCALPPESIKQTGKVRQHYSDYIPLKCLAGLIHDNGPGQRAAVAGHGRPAGPATVQ
ncbi:hypothetical protein O1611_g7291 [Lasiodiplodia mahajangana]|uniref:Uncharacterized protein n=1 Tax=Lasiodiplodia mahajangana TaxID=1108764 RepID=A0ACC2JG32_9PEZI|nr:hypothetical protein O1611_g7291 [Lasiodiplodia mahajangana]